TWRAWPEDVCSEVIIRLLFVDGPAEGRHRPAVDRHRPGRRGSLRAGAMRAGHRPTLLRLTVGGAPAPPRSHGRWDARPAPSQKPWARRWNTWLVRRSWAKERTVVSSSMIASSRSPMVARSSQTSRPTAVVITVWWAAPAVSQHSAEVAKSGAGSQTAQATGRFGSS